MNRILLTHRDCDELCTGGFCRGEDVKLEGWDSKAFMAMRRRYGACAKALRSGHFPQALILAGPKGAGKYTLALMLAQAVNCLEPTEIGWAAGFLRACANCTRIAESANLEERVAEAVAARDDMRDADKRETRILIQTHPDVLIVPPDPPQLMIKMGQVREVIHAAYYRPPAEARRAFFNLHVFGVYEGSGEQPVEGAGRAAGAHVADSAHRESARTAANDPVARTAVQAGRASGGRDRGTAGGAQAGVEAAQRALAARLAEGAVGRALTMDLEVYLASRTGCATDAADRAARAGLLGRCFTRRKHIAAAQTGRRRRSTCCARLGVCSKTCC